MKRARGSWTLVYCGRPDSNLGVPHGKSHIYQSRIPPGQEGYFGSTRSSSGLSCRRSTDSYRTAHLRHRQMRKNWTSASHISYDCTHRASEIRLHTLWCLKGSNVLKNWFLFFLDRSFRWFKGTEILSVCTWSDQISLCLILQTDLLHPFSFVNQNNMASTYSMSDYVAFCTIFSIPWDQ